MAFLFKKRTAKKEEDVLQRVAGMVRDREAQKLATDHSLSLQNVSWEDNARDKGSCWGPCISDMTLVVDNTNLPVIRYPNFEDLTWDVPMERIMLRVGNEKGEQALRTVSLRTYLAELRSFLHRPDGWAGINSSLYDETRDSHVIVSAQACFLPVPQGGEAKFNVNLYNYQSRTGDPAVLAIVATAQGTSAQIVNASGQHLYFNKNGERASFIGQRLSDNRQERGVIEEQDKGKKKQKVEMTAEEKQNNMVAIIQVPLKRKGPEDDWSSDGCEDEDEDDECCSDSDAECDVEDAIIKVGEAEGEFQEIGGLDIERDTRFPVRVTLQFYKTTSNGEINNAVVATIASQIDGARGNAAFLSSLVVEGDTGRPTEWAA